MSGLLLSKTKQTKKQQHPPPPTHTHPDKKQTIIKKKKKKQNGTALPKVCICLHNETKFWSPFGTEDSKSIVGYGT